MKLQEPTSEADVAIFKTIRRTVRKNITMPLYHYQYQGVYGIEKTHGRALLAGDMGTGKTAQSLGWTQLYPGRRPVLIVCPATLKFNWEDEIRKWLNKDSIVLSGRTPYRFPSQEYIIINYEILDSWKQMILESIKPEIVIFDEATYMKSRTAIRTAACAEVGKAIKYAICLTGTPVENRPCEIFPMVSMLQPDLFSGFYAFAMRYCDGKKKYGHWDFTGSSHVKELHEKLTSNVMIRVKKCDVLKDLPGKTRTVIPFEIDLKEYLEAEENLIEWLKKVNPDKVEKAQSCEALTKIGYLKRLSAKSKIKEVCAWVKTFLDTTDQKIILFGVHHEILDEVYRIFKKEAVLLTGETKQEDRKKAVYSFQNDPKVRVFIGGIKSAGVGLTLTSASTVAFVEMGWTPGEHLQCEDRANRIGQKNNVTCYYLLSKGTIEVDICQIIQKKQEVIEALVDGHESVQDWDVYSDLIKRLKSKHKPS